MNTWWLQLRDFLAGLFAAPQLRGKGVSVGRAIPIAGTGYSTAAARASATATLRHACYEIITDPAWRARGDVTFCNLAVARVAFYTGCAPLVVPMPANAMYYFMANPLNGFRRDSGPRAAEHAMRGGLAIASKRYPEHGHVAVVFPEPCQLSGSWGKLVPMVANVGKNNGLMKTSEAFPTALGEPDYFLWGETA